MDFGLTEEQQLLLASLDEILDQYATPSYLAQIEREHRQPVEFKRALHEAGFLSLGIPEALGGTPVDMVTMCLIGERVASRGLNLGYATEILQVLDILEFGTPEQQETVLGLLQAGEVPFALAFTEPQAGSDSSGMRLTAVHQDGMVTFNGTKTLVTNAVNSRFLLTMAVNPDDDAPAVSTASVASSTLGGAGSLESAGVPGDLMEGAGPQEKAGARDRRRPSISMYLVPVDAPGITLSPIEKIGWHTADSSEIYYDGVTVPESCLVGVKGQGFKQLMKNFELERIMTATQSLGLAQAAFDDAASYAATRQQFGRAIGDFQLIQEKLTDMEIKLQNMRNFVYRSAWMVDNGTLDRKQAAMCKRYCSMAAFEVCDDALQIHGGIGATEGVRIERLWRDARLHRIGGGTDEIMVHVAGREIVREHRG